jgi:hypothetical protein
LAVTAIDPRTAIADTLASAFDGGGVGVGCGDDDGRGVDDGWVDGVAECDAGVELCDVDGCAVVVLADVRASAALLW